MILQFFILTDCGLVKRVTIDFQRIRVVRTDYYFLLNVATLFEIVGSSFENLI